MRAILITISVIAGALWGLDKIGVTPIAPGTDLHFSHSFHKRAEQNWLVLKSDTGTQKCWIRLVLNGAFKTTPSLDVEFATGQRLRSNVYYAGHDMWAIDIFNAATNTRARPMFDWESGDRVLVRIQPAIPVSLHDWTVYLEKEESDSLSKARRRQQWFYASIALLIISIGSGTYGALKDAEKKPHPFTPQTCILQIVEDIETVNPDESAKMRELLSRVLLTGGGGTIKEVMADLGIPEKEQPALWFKARRQFLNRLEYLIEHLQEARERLRNEKKA